MLSKSLHVKTKRRQVLSLLFLVFALGFNLWIGSHLCDTHPITCTDIPSNIEWQKFFGGRGKEDGWALSTTMDGGYIIVGSTSSYGGIGEHAWLVKLDDAGNEQWNRTYGGTKSDYAFSGQQTSDEGYILTGGTTSFGAGDHDVLLIKTDTMGEEIWNVTFGGEERDQGYAVQQTSDNGYIIVGGTGSYSRGPNDYWVIKTDEQGSMEWNTTLGTDGYDWGYDVLQTGDGSFVLTGGTDVLLLHKHILDIGLYKLNAKGSLVWESRFNKPPARQRWDEGYGVQQTSDDGYIIAGIAHTYGWSESGEGDAWLIKTDETGNKLWDRVFGGNSCDCFSSVQQTADGGYILAGWTYSFGAGDADLWLLRTDETGKELWDMTIGGENYEWSMLHTLQQSNDGGYLLLGTTQSYGGGYSDLLLTKVREPSIRIDFAGSGASITIRNTGSQDLVDLPWSIDIQSTGFLATGGHQEGYVTVPAGGNTTITSTVLLMGFGECTMRVTAGEIGNMARFLLLGPFVFPY
jgi:hypothetical protein